VDYEANDYMVEEHGVNYVDYEANDYMVEEDGVNHQFTEDIYNPHI
jgi:hypothetical protein